MDFSSDAHIVVDELDKYLREARERRTRVIDQQPLEKLVDDLGLETLASQGGLAGDGLRNFVADYLDASTRLHHPAYLAHQVAVPHPTGALAALIDGLTNNAMAIYEMGPGAATIEYFVINRLLQKVGWQPAPLKPRDDRRGQYGGGVLTHGGSLANLTALQAARSRIAPDAWHNGTPNDLALLAPQGSHYSIARAAGILGIGQKNLYPLPVDARGVVLPDQLPKIHKRLTDHGKRPLALVASAGSTAVGLYDPLQEIGTFCREKKIWLHIDGAHGAGALFSRRYRHRMNGVELADSLTWDAHKLLRTPTLCAALLVRDHGDLDRAFEQEASYLFHDKARPGFDFIHRTVECTKAGLGLRLFLVLAAMGERGLEAYIDSRFALTETIYDYMQTLPGIECPIRPQANILCFRVMGSDARQIQIRNRLIETGDFYLSTAEINGRRYLRIVLMNPETNLSDIHRLMESIETGEAIPEA